MDFLKKKMKELLNDDKKDDGHGSGHEQGPPQQRSDGQPQCSASPPQGPAAPYGAPPPLPPGWHAQFDQQSQRWYYIEQATGRTQWDMPTLNAQGPYAPPPPGAPSYGSHDQGWHVNDDRGLFGQNAGYHQQEEKKSRGMGKMLAAGTVGAVGGAWIGHELTEGESDDEHKAAAAPPPAAAPPGYGGDPGYGAGADSGYGEPSYVSTAPLPDEAADGDSVSSSDKESLDDKRGELEEAQEEYNEQYEETYDD